jgi:taurine transport system substrate-binding protein
MQKKGGNDVLSILNRKAFRLFLAGLLFLSLVVGCSPVAQPSAGEQEAPAPEKKPVVVIYGGTLWLGNYPAMVGIEKGFFDEEGLIVEWREFPTSAARMTAMAAGQIDFGSAGIISVLSLMAAGEEGFYVIGTQDRYVGQEGLLSQPEITTIEQLRGQKIAVTFNSSSHNIVIDVLQQHGLDHEKDVELINIKTAEMMSAFATKQVAAVATWVPAFSQIKDLPGTNVLALDTDTTFFKEYGVGPGPDCLVISKRFVDENPDEARALMRAYYKALKYLRDNPDECIDLLIEYTGVTQEQQKETLAHIEWLDETEQHKMMITPGNFVSAMRVLAKFLWENGLVSGEPDVERWVNTDILPE